LPALLDGTWLAFLAVMRLQIAFLGAALAVGCGGSQEDSPGLHRYTVDVSQYTAPNEPPSLFIPSSNLALPLEAKDLSLTDANPGSLQAVYTRSYCEAGHVPTELAGWDNVELMEVTPVHLTSVRITIAFDGNDLVKKPSFSVRSAGTWSSCTVATDVAKNSTSLTATLPVDVADATDVAIFPDTYTYVHEISYTTRD
jgi:hypothetical protein